MIREKIKHLRWNNVVWFVLFVAGSLNAEAHGRFYQTFALPSIVVYGQSGAKLSAYLTIARESSAR